VGVTGGGLWALKWTGLWALEWGNCGRHRLGKTAGVTVLGLSGSDVTAYLLGSACGL